MGTLAMQEKPCLSMPKDQSFLQKIRTMINGLAIVVLPSIKEHGGELFWLIDVHIVYDVH